MIKCKKGKHSYAYTKPISEGVHKLILHRRTDFGQQKTIFHGIEIADGKRAALAPRPKYKIEFYGDSITCGLGNEGLSRTKNSQQQFANNYLSYGAIASRALNTEDRAIAKGGIGVVCGFVPFTMPEIFDRKTPFDTVHKHDFSKWQPDILVINLLQNDSAFWNKPDHPEFKKRFPEGQDEELVIQTYSKLLLDLIQKYPNAKFICTLGPMSASSEQQPWFDFIKDAIRFLDGEDGVVFENIHTLRFPYNQKKTQVCSFRTYTLLPKSDIMHT